MGMDSFSEDDDIDLSDIDVSNEMARPRVHGDTHMLVKDFSKHSGFNMPSSYSIILKEVLTNEELLSEVLSSTSTEVDELTDHHLELLEDIADIVKHYGRFPTREEINGDRLSPGFPIFIMHFGSKDRIKEALEEHYPEAYEKID